MPILLKELSMHEDTLVGQEFAGYRILAELGRGGMGVVYLAEEIALQRKVALKVLAARLSGNPAFVARFLREARAIAKLDHPSIVRVHAVGEAHGKHFISMEYVNGSPLSDVIAERGALPPDEAYAITRQIAQALVHAQTAGIIHRDIKPQNIMIDEAGRVRVMDFGLAKLLDSQSNVTEAGTVLGTPLYMAPEQIRGGKIDGRADLFSLGILLYEMLTGHPPFNGDTPLEAMYKIAHDPLPPLDAASLASLPELAEIVARLTAKEPERRWTSAAELLEALDQIVGLESDAGPKQHTLLRRAFLLGFAGAATVAVSVAGLFYCTRTTPELDLPPGTAEVVDLGNGVQLELVWIPPGEFVMGSSRLPLDIAAAYGGERGDYLDEHPHHTVVLSQGFWMGKYEVTIEQYQQFDPEFTPMAERIQALPDPRRPVSNVSWRDATAFCGWLSGKTGDHYRLPLESEWEYACRAGTTTERYWGDDDTSMAEYANVFDQSLAGLPMPMRLRGRPVDINDGFASSAPVGSFKPNAWGLYDMIGNVAEYCLDWQGQYRETTVVDPKGPRRGDTRTVRGGSWTSDAGAARSASRVDASPEDRNPYRGFRVVRLP
jgi:formylglycine-generating enzyme required for sulfatase activity/predicted Ser/Thr protein kinase